MCGISVIIKPEGGIRLRELERMNQLIAHRGPDDEGYALFSPQLAPLPLAGKDTAMNSLSHAASFSPVAFLNAVDGKYEVGMGHRRLSILDLSPAGHMPFCDAKARYWIAYNGEVYNFIELREKLEKRGCAFHSQSDTEVVLKAWMEWGPKAFDKFRGMFALVIYDSRERRFWMLRDRFGIKPLYYWSAPDGSLYIGSEIKQFTASEQWRARVNPNRFQDYLQHSLTDHRDESLFEGVHQLPPGHFAQFTLEELKKSSSLQPFIKSWYSLNLNPELERLSHADAKAAFADCFRETVQLHLRADVPVGSALSGGLDSSAIVCQIQALRQTNGKVQPQLSFSSVHPNPGYSETPWMQAVVEHTGVKAHYVQAQAQDLMSHTDRVLYQMDEPYQSQSAYLGYRVFESAAQAGVRVLLNGQGADEYLSAYGLFRDFRLRRHLSQGRFLRYFKETAQEGKATDIQLHLRMLAMQLPESWRRRLNGRHAAGPVDRLIDWEKLGSNREHPFATLRYQDDYRSLALHQLGANPLPRYLRWEDRNSMAHSVEARVPFLDHKLVELALSLPLHELDGPNEAKKIMREALAPILPEKIRNRRDKQGFITPEELWVKQEATAELRQALAESIERSNGIIKPESLHYFDEVVSGKRAFDYTYWRLILAGRWMQLFDVTV